MNDELRSKCMHKKNTYLGFLLGGIVGSSILKIEDVINQLR